MTTVERALNGVSKLGIDTAPLIYFIERHPTYLDKVKEVLRYVDNGSMHGYSASITLTEVLTLPKRTQNQQLVDIYRRYLLNSRNFTLVSITPEIAEIASDIRANYEIKTPDALQIAAALMAKCEAFLTNDKGLLRVKEFKIILLADLI